jgi:hypothetical protein
MRCHTLRGLVYISRPCSANLFPSPGHLATQSRPLHCLRLLKCRAFRLEHSQSVCRVTDEACFGFVRSSPPDISRMRGGAPRGSSPLSDRSLVSESSSLAYAATAKQGHAEQCATAYPCAWYTIKLSTNCNFGYRTNQRCATLCSLARAGPFFQRVSNQAVKERSR